LEAAKRLSTPVTLRSGGAAGFHSRAARLHRSTDAGCAALLDGEGSAPWLVNQSVRARLCSLASTYGGLISRPLPIAPPDQLISLGPLTGSTSTRSRASASSRSRKLASSTAAVFSKSASAASVLSSAVRLGGFRRGLEGRRPLQMNHGVYGSIHLGGPEVLPRERRP